MNLESEVNIVKKLSVRLKTYLVGQKRFPFM